MTQPIIEHAKTPKNQLELLRVLMIPALLNTFVLFPALLLGAAMSSDSGTPEAIRGSYIALLLAVVYVGAVLLGIIVWDKASLLSGILISLFAVGNIVPAIYLKTTELLMLLVPWQDLGLPRDSSLTTLVDAVVGVGFGIVVPIVSAWRLFRHAFELDVVDHTRPAELWDLKRINK